MEFEVNYIRNYTELIVTESRTTLETGLLDDKEALSLGSDMFDAAQKLLGEDAFKILIKEHFTQEDLFGGE